MLTNCALSRRDQGWARPRVPKPKKVSPGVARPAGTTCCTGGVEFGNNFGFGARGRAPPWSRRLGCDHW